VFAYFKNYDEQPSAKKLKEKYLFLTDFKIKELQEKYHLIWNFTLPNSKGYKSKEELSSRFR
jgi:hypothetical protein